jgi:hypothetical protein
MRLTLASMKGPVEVRHSASVPGSSDAPGACCIMPLHVDSLCVQDTLPNCMLQSCLFGTAGVKWALCTDWSSFLLYQLYRCLAIVLATSLACWCQSKCPKHAACTFSAQLQGDPDSSYAQQHLQCHFEKGCRTLPDDDEMNFSTVNVRRSDVPSLLKRFSQVLHDRTFGIL